jgi:hypothetical protein
MPLYDQDDMLKRLLGQLPAGWFGTEHPTLDAIMTAFAAMYAEIEAEAQYLKDQMRIATADLPFLELMGYDYLNGQFPPRYQESPNTYRVRLKANILRERNTRQAYISVLQDLTGRTPIVLEGFMPLDTNYLNGGFVLGINSLGSGLEAEITIIAFRPFNNSTAQNGLNNDTYSLNSGFYLADGKNEFLITDDDIRQAVESVRMGGIKVNLIITD